LLFGCLLSPHHQKKCQFDRSDSSSHREPRLDESASFLLIFPHSLVQLLDENATNLPIVTILSGKTIKNTRIAVVPNMIYCVLHNKRTTVGFNPMEVLRNTYGAIKDALDDE